MHEARRGGQEQRPPERGPPGVAGGDDAPEDGTEQGGVRRAQVPSGSGLPK
ncbi:unnamed protein product, partial [Pylaiella littoralis]